MFRWPNTPRSAWVARRAGLWRRAQRRHACRRALCPRPGRPVLHPRRRQQPAGQRRRFSRRRHPHRRRPWSSLCSKNPTDAPASKPTPASTGTAVVRPAVEQNCAGIECLAGIPGNVGGTPVQNVGAYGQEVSDTIVQRPRASISTAENGRPAFRRRLRLHAIAAASSTAHARRPLRHHACRLLAEPRRARPTSPIAT